MYDKSGCLEVCWQIVPPNLRSSCTEGFVAEVGARPTDEKRASISRASVDDEAAVVSQVAGSLHCNEQCNIGKRTKLANCCVWNCIKFLQLLTTDICG